MNSTSPDELKLQNGSSSLSSSGNNNSRNVENKEEKSLLDTSIINWEENSTAQSPVLSSNHRLTPILNQVCNLSPVLPRVTTPNLVASSSTLISTPAPAVPLASVFETPAASPAFSSISTSSLSSSVAPPIVNRSPLPLSSRAMSIDSSSIPSISSLSPVPSSSSNTDTGANPATSIPIIPIAPVRHWNFEIMMEIKFNLTIWWLLQVQPLHTSVNLPKPDQWLGSITSSVPTSQTQPTVPPVPAPRRAPPIHARALSDPFDAGWADLKGSSTTNPFIVPNTTQAFQVILHAEYKNT